MPNQVSGAIPKGKAVLLTGGYDHTIRFWELHSGLSFRTMQYPDSVKPIPTFSNSDQLFSFPAFTKILDHSLSIFFEFLQTENFSLSPEIRTREFTRWICPMQATYINWMDTQQMSRR